MIVTPARPRLSLNPTLSPFGGEGTDVNPLSLGVGRPFDAGPD